MAFDKTKPMDDEYIAAGPAAIRENLRALKEDQIVDAGTVNGLAVGNASGNIPKANGTLCTNLNAQYLGGNLAGYFSPATHTHSAATTSSNGMMANTDKAKLDGIAAGAQVNQNAFAGVLIGGTTIQADAATDTLELVGGANIALIPDATNDRVTIAVAGKVASAVIADTAAACTGNAATAAACTGNAATATTAGACTGNAATATKLAAARTINGVAFDGSTNITVVDNTKAPIASPSLAGIPTAPTAELGSSSTQIATTAFVQAAIQAASATVPIGGIIMWSGSALNIPHGWELCNGSGGTPNLLDRFVLGAGGNYVVGEVGGEATHTLTVAEMPNHVHEILNMPVSATDSGGGHYNRWAGNTTRTTAGTGGDEAHNNMPPYYALAFIIRIS